MIVSSSTETSASGHGSVPVAATRARSRWPVLVLGLTSLAAVLTVVGLALLWIDRNPVIAHWDYLGHANVSMADAALARAHRWGALRDQIFLFNRWEPPGLRLLGLPVAVAFGPDPFTALRLSSTAMFVLTGLVLFLGLRRFAGFAGALAAVLLYALAPVNLTGAQNFMTESVLQLYGAASVGLLAAELRAANGPDSLPGAGRLTLLGLAMGWGTLTKLIFLPTYGIPWVAVVAWRWWRERDPATLLLRLLLPGLVVTLIAWPHYVLNGARYAAYAKATAGGFGADVWPERGFAFIARAVLSLIADVFGPGGAIVLVLGLALAWLARRRIAMDELVFALLCVVGTFPTLSAFFLSSNQTDRYIAPDVLLLGVPVAVGFGAALRGGWQAGRIAVLAGGAAATAQIVVSWVLPFRPPVTSPLLSGLAKATTRTNYACDYAPLARMTAARNMDGTVRLGVYGLSESVNESDFEYAYRRQEIPAQVIDLETTSATTIDWDRVLREANQLDYVVMPEPAGDAFVAAAHAINQTLGEFRSRLAAVAQANDIGQFRFGPDVNCTVRLLAVHPLPGAAPPQRPPLRPEVHFQGLPDDG
jgi:hypothetical protein